MSKGRGQRESVTGPYPGSKVDKNATVEKSSHPLILAPEALWLHPVTPQPG
jgi:hypothetical protein